MPCSLLLHTDVLYTVVFVIYAFVFVFDTVVIILYAVVFV